MHLQRKRGLSRRAETCAACGEGLLRAQNQNRFIYAPLVVLGEQHQFTYLQCLEENTDIVNRRAACKDRPRNQLEQADTEGATCSHLVGPRSRYTKLYSNLLDELRTYTIVQTHQRRRTGHPRKPSFQKQTWQQYRTVLAILTTLTTVHHSRFPSCPRQPTKKQRSRQPPRRIWSVHIPP